MNNFPLRLRELRNEQGYTQKQLAEKLNYTQSNICEWEKGTVEPRASALNALANLFSVSVDFLIGRTDDLGAISSYDLISSACSPKEQQLIRCFRELPESSQDLILGMVKSAADAAKRP